MVSQQPDSMDMTDILDKAIVAMRPHSRLSIKRYKRQPGNIKLI